MCDSSQKIGTTLPIQNHLRRIFFLLIRYVTILATLNHKLIFHIDFIYFQLKPFDSKEDFAVFSTAMRIISRFKNKLPMKRKRNFSSR